MATKNDTRDARETTELGDTDEAKEPVLTKGDSDSDTGTDADARTDTETDTDAADDTDVADEADVDPEDDHEPVPAGAASEGVGLGAGAVVSAALGVVSLTGGWLGTVAAARSSLEGQIETSQGGDAAKQIQAVYGDSWEVTALIGGVFALAALLVGALVLARPAFGTPRPAPAAWIRSVAWGGVALGVIGLVLAVAKYTDLLLSLPSAPGAS
ncbi:hypothetical protein HUT18_26230 [Streptomyces sp. NA04227]|uniref:hypothetical protein n=1 Tax=Streptomyces sp. NA04227 TaxID=2742136 RepID=UPI0015901136|nr:hypothetical protein [Streptomyces sp. NA04227]QKW09363.1 hypothetical protein HUT18_26230 [Streptomyces sp. NA04227]